MVMLCIAICPPAINVRITKLAKFTPIFLAKYLCFVTMGLKGIINQFVFRSNVFVNKVVYALHCRCNVRIRWHIWTRFTIDRSSIPISFESGLALGEKILSSRIR